MDDKLLLDFIDTWNKNNPNEKLSPYVISQVGMYLNMAKSIGYDMALNEFKENIKYLELQKGSIMIRQLFGLMKIDNMILFKAEAGDLRAGEECYLKDYKTPFVVLDSGEKAVRIQHKKRKYIKRLSPGWPVMHENKNNAKTLILS